MARTGTSPELTLWVDGACSFCSWLGRWLRRRAQRRGIQLQLRALPEGSEAVLVEYARRRFEADEALIVVLHALGGIYRGGAWLLRVLPRGVRRGVYRWVARQRYRLFGYARCVRDLQ
jgi:predicted DCC family thiol-disulfide oxidoreductase YuxK